MTTDMALTAALRTNALCSLTTGSVLFVAPASVSTWLGLALDGWIRLLGAGLVAHAIGLAWASRRRDCARWGRVNIAFIAPYPFVLLGFAATGLVDRSEGVVILLLDALLVASLAIWQWSALGRTSAPDLVVPA